MTTETEKAKATTRPWQHDNIVLAAKSALANRIVQNSKPCYYFRGLQRLRHW